MSPTLGERSEQAAEPLAGLGDGPPEKFYKNLVFLTIFGNRENDLIRPVILETSILRYELNNEGVGQNTSQPFDGGFGSMR